MEDGVRRQILGRTLFAAMPDANDDDRFHQALRDEPVGRYVGAPGTDVAVFNVGFKAVLAIVHVEDGVMPVGFVVVIGRQIDV